MKERSDLAWTGLSRPARLAWVVAAGVALGFLLISIPAYYLAFEESIAAEPLQRVLAVVSLVASLFAALLSLGLAALLFVRRGADLMALFASYYLLAYGVIGTGPMERLERLWPGWSAMALDYFQPLLLFAPTVALFLLFPTGSFRPRQTRWLVVTAILLSPVLITTGLLDSGTLLSAATYLGLASSSLVVVIYRYRVLFTPAEKQQTKWVVAGFLLWLVTLVLLSIPYILIENLPPGEPAPLWASSSSVLWWLSVNILPVSLTLAILRYRLWEIDRILSRTLVYTILTSVLALTYFGSVVFFQGLFRTVAGQDSPLAIVLSTLVIAAIFQPLRRRLQQAIDRRFYRRNYDAAQALTRFAATARDEVDLDELTAALVQTVDETVQPAGVWLWLRPRNLDL